MGHKMKRILYILLALAVVLFLGTVLVFAALPENVETAWPLSGAQAKNSPVIISRAEKLSPASEESSQIQEAAPLAEQTTVSPVEEEPSPAGEETPPPAEETASSQAAEEAPSSSSEAPPAPASEEATPQPEQTGPAVREYTPPQNLPIPEGEERWALRLVNWENPLPWDFAPEYEEVQNRFVMDKRVAPIARRMILDAWDQGVTLIVNSGYRPYSAQQTVYDARYQKHLAEGRTEAEAKWLTESYVAIPGYSEHQLGLALDIVAVQDSETAKGWLAAHAQDYGFILRYPKDKVEITHTAYESWHYRYVGIAAAQEITSRGLCLEEYLAER